MKFQDMNLHASLNQALAKMNFEDPTEIQAAAIPIALQGKDILGSAQTGTGKTAAFAVPMIQKLLENPEMTALILVPTRELAVQVEEVVRKLTNFCREIRSVTLIGGVSMVPQFRLLKQNPRIVVATPGRLIDHMERKTVHLNMTGFLVLDEADRMLDMGFAPQLKEIVKHLPKKRQNLLFSATFPLVLIKMAKEFMADPARVAVKTEQVSPDRISQTSIQLRHDEKPQALLKELDERHGTFLVFAKTQRNTEKLGLFLQNSGVNAAIIHGGRTQAQRMNALQSFRNGQSRVLVATDVAARGIDVPHVEHVINYDLPQVPEDYVHRIGRTGRAGRTGQAVSFLTTQDREMWRDIQRLMNPLFKEPKLNRSQSQKPAKPARSGGGSFTKNKAQQNKRFGGRKPASVGASSKPRR